MHTNKFVWIMSCGALLIFCGVPLVHILAEQSEGAGSFSFDVVSIRQNISGKGFALDYTSNGFTATNMPIQAVIVNAYKLRDPELMIGGKLLPGAPSWVNSDRYDIQGKMSPSDLAATQKLSPEQQTDRIRLMLQSMLADRFKLKVRKEGRVTPCYALVVDKNGVKLKVAATSNPGIPDGTMLARPGYVEGQGIPLSTLVFALTAPLNCPLEDRTGLSNRYDLTLQYAIDQNFSAYGNAPASGQRDPNTSPDASGPALFSAVREQLGLRLVPIKVPVESIFIEHVERPSAN